MSIKRTKQVTRGKGRESDVESPFPSSKPQEPAWNWAEHVGAAPEESFAPYALASTFSKGALLVHPKFGKGVVTAAEGTRIEVLFEEGTKKLGHATA